MRQVIYPALLFTASAAMAAPFSHALLDSVLRHHVDARGRVDYAGLQQAPSRLQGYLDSLAACSPLSEPQRFPTPAHALAYWINAYNALVLGAVVQAYPVSSVWHVPPQDSLFARRAFVVGGRQMTLDEIEHDAIRPQSGDPRTHFVLNCGAASCPPLEPRAFTGEDLEVRLGEAARRFARSEQQVRWDRPAGVLHLSRIMDWYGRDFGVDAGAGDPQAAVLALLRYLAPYLDDSVRAELQAGAPPRLEFDDYDWSLNDQGRPRR